MPWSVISLASTVPFENDGPTRGFTNEAPSAQIPALRASIEEFVAAANFFTLGTLHA